MDENPTSHPGVPTEQYHALGPKTLLIFALQRMHAASAIFLLGALLFAVKDQPFLKNLPIAGDISPYVGVLTAVAVGAFTILFLGTFLVSWIIYIHYKFFLGENALKIKRGIFLKEEVAIPYRQIQDVNIVRDLGFQMMGLSKLTILTAGHDDSNTEGDESEGIFPALEKNLAEWLQAELLKRANVQKVVETH